MVDFSKRSFWNFTLKDILSIISSVAIPIALAIYTAIGSQQQKQQAEKKQKFDFEQSRELRQQTLYDEFLNNIYKLDKDDYLNDSKNPWAFANAYYRAAHRQWDTIRKADVLQFLKEKQLIGRNNCTNGCRTTKLDDIIRLNELNFNNVHLASETGILNKLNLQCISFDQVSMSNAVFSFASLNGVSFDGARLDNAKFDDSSLLCASFNGTNLTDADFGNSDLTGTHFSNSDLSGAKITEDQIKQAYFHNVTMPNGEKSEIKSSSTTKKPIIKTTTIIKTKMSTTTSTIAIASTTGNVWNTSGITILDSSQVTKVANIYIDSNNTLYITDETPSAVVWRLLQSTTSATVIAGIKSSSGSSSTQLDLPQGVYVDTNGAMYVSDFYNHRVQKFINGSTVGSTIAGITSSAGSSLNQLDGPRFITLDPTQAYIYIADGVNNRIIRHSTTSTSGDNGAVVAGGNGAGNTNTSLNHPWGIWYQSSVSSDLFITNYDGHSIIRWTPGASSGTFIAGVPGTAGSNSTLLNNPMGIKLDNYLNMFVVDNSNHRIQMFCTNSQIGITIAGTGISGSTATTLNGPRGIAFDSEMHMYITDFGNMRVQKFLKL
ncbi:unnamed protein product [Adineta steineri]|uniref:Uncharacterized protein n=2 Tax=Adineta steineri TaxID=433720 RepID=A0A813RB36_9BILA|nr:unnamed protein product [Adineta steineri]CAF3515237.1 unnamed protein product [Adineta steineri]